MHLLVKYDLQQHLPHLLLLLSFEHFDRKVVLLVAIKETAQPNGIGFHPDVLYLQARAFLLLD